MKKKLSYSVAVLTVTLLLAVSAMKPSGSVRMNGGIFTTTDPQTGENILVRINDFEIDKYLVTVKEFEEFTRQTGYKTQAEAYGNSLIFDFKTGQWQIEEGADFRHPFGPDMPAALPDHPVTQVSWNDATAYAHWKGKRLPTDAEWEYAASKAGQTRSIYPWGDQSENEGQYKANYWQGSFPYYNSGADGFLTTSPAGYFGEDLAGLTDMGGNVWQWCTDTIQPTGCNADEDPSSRKVCRGGSFLCDKNVCHGFKIGNRTNSTAESGMVHVGFRLVKDIK